MVFATVSANRHHDSRHRAGGRKLGLETGGSRAGGRKLGLETGGNRWHRHGAPKADVDRVARLLKMPRI